ncbi:MAG: alkaline phosphatase family protein [Clostridia bacterium]|nr:alkaline phosphatase family protein [Clostridia bacterium]
MKKYSHVAVIGIDGMGIFNRAAKTPCMDRIFENGAVTYEAYSMDPTISAENWGGMLIGTEPAVHNLTNGYICVHPYKNDKFPTVFARLRKAYPDALLASIVNWNPINIGIVEDGLGVIKETADNDPALTEKIVECVAKKPVFLFVQLDDVDGAGHHFGYGEEGHIKSIEETDALVGRIYAAYEKADIADDTLFICLADHGGYIRGHGGWHDTEKKIFFGVSGKGVKKGEIPFAVTKDISALVLYALGLEVPAYTPGGYTSQVPENVFEDYPREYVIPSLPETAKQQAHIPFDEPGGLKEIFGSSLRLRMPFENSLEDETGICKTTECGAVKFYTNGMEGSIAEFGATGAVKIENAPLTGGFSLAFWLIADKDIEQNICVLGTKSPEHGKHQEKGFNVILRNHSVMVQYGCGDDDTDTVTAFGADGFSGPVHIALTFDTATGETKCYLNFALAHTDVIDKKYISSLAGGGLVLGDDIYLSYNKSRGIIFRLDDLMLFDGCIGEREIKKLADYYSA